LVGNCLSNQEINPLTAPLDCAHVEFLGVRRKVFSSPLLSGMSAVSRVDKGLPAVSNIGMRWVDSAVCTLVGSKIGAMAIKENPTAAPTIRIVDVLKIRPLKFNPPLWSTDHLSHRLNEPNIVLFEANVLILSELTIFAA
jgi:hypothetical protein